MFNSRASVVQHLEDSAPVTYRSLTLPHGLTVSPRKRELYALDHYFREAWEDAQSIWGSQCQTLLATTAAILLKPENLVARRTVSTMSYLRSAGFSPVAFSEIRLSRHRARELWRFQFNSATLVRFEFIDLWSAGSPALFILLRDENLAAATSGELAQPRAATERLTALKGPALSTERLPTDLRSHLGQRNSLLNFVHTSDEPAEVVRDLGVLLSRAARRRMFRAVLRGQCVMEPLQARIGRLYRYAPLHDLHFDQALARIRVAVSDAAHRSPAKKRLAVLRHEWASVRAGVQFDWRQLFEQTRRAGVSVAQWDFIVVAAELTTPAYSWPAVFPLLSSVNKHLDSDGDPPNRPIHERST